MTRAHWQRGWNLPKTERAAHDAMFVDTGPDVYRITATWPSCSGACEQGRRLCVSPEACQLGESETLPTPVFRWFGAALAIVVVALVLALLFGSR